MAKIIDYYRISFIRCNNDRLLQVSVKLRAYEEAVQEAAEAGLLISFVTDTMNQDAYAESDLAPIVTERWNVFQAIFFASTVLTTIGNPRPWLLAKSLLFIDRMEINLLFYQRTKNYIKCEIWIF